MFHFLLYLKPNWYYRLAHKSSALLLADYTRLDSREKAFLDWDGGYSDERARVMDAAYQGLYKGLIPDADSALAASECREISDVGDNYRFVRRYFGLHWYLYVFLLRLFSLHNPFREARYFLKNLRTKRVDMASGIGRGDLPKNFDSALVRSRPLVSLIIPTLDRYDYLRAVLKDLEDQDYQNFEVIVCDQSQPFRADFYDSWKLDLRVIEQSERALWLARNTCIRAAKGDFIALTEDDVRLPADWLTNHLKCLDYFAADASCGIFFPEGATPAPAQRLFRLSDIFATGNTLIRKQVFYTTGLFDRQFEGQRMGDGEFGLRCLLHGFRLVLNPLAYCVDIKAPTGGLRQMGSWDSWRPTRFFAPRPVPSVLYYVRKYFGAAAAVYYLLPNVMASYIPYAWKRHRTKKLLAFALIFIIFPFVLVSLMRSWRLAGQKLRIGEKIDRIDAKN
ncbi:MAG: glycosyltransferase family 2 protein [Saprospiraceae bacterium]